MASRRVLPDTVVLSNYVGEVNDVATYQTTVLKHCYCPVEEGAAQRLPATSEADEGVVYIFDRNTVATDESGNVRTYLSYDLWRIVTDKTPYWTLNTDGKDKFKKYATRREYRIESFAHRVNGSPRMWHFEVRGK